MRNPVWDGCSPLRLLAIETSCDETSAAVVEDGELVLSCVVASQMDIHARFGGIYPEAASRQHVLAIDHVVHQALTQAAVSDPGDLGAVAVTRGPGLVGSLLVGVNMAKGLCLSSGLPLLGVNHLWGHIYSLWLRDGNAIGCESRELAFPLVFLIVSGGHTELVLMEDHGQVRALGGTLDDAAGEAFDKVARLLDLGFPGGPAIQKAALDGDPGRYDLPYPLRGNPKHRFDFSFSGLKTHMLHRVRAMGADAPQTQPQAVSDLAAAFEAQVATLLLDRVEDAVREFGAGGVCLCGGVSANQRLRREAEIRFRRIGVPMRIPSLTYCTDNAAMIGAAAGFRLRRDPQARDGLDLDVMARLPL